MDFGVVVPSSWGARQLVDTAVAAETAGLDFFLVTDHYLTPNASTSVDAWALLAGIATVTEKIRIGTCVTPVPFRPPQMLAKVIATVDQLSDGRVVPGIGAGWHRPEFDAYSRWESDKVRVAKTVEGLGIMTRLWTSKEPFDFDGKYYSVRGALLEPKPLQRPFPPLWFGTNGSYMLKTALKYGDGWVPPVPGVGMETYRSVFARLKEGSAAVPRARPVGVRFNGTLEEISSRIQAYAEMGCVGGMLARVPYEEIVPAMQKLAREIAPSYR